MRVHHDPQPGVGAALVFPLTRLVGIGRCLEEEATRRLVIGHLIIGPMATVLD